LRPSLFAILANNLKAA
jgi:hypothetical protein